MAEKTLTSKIQLRNDTASAWTTTNPKLLKGEIGIEIDTRKFKIGDGTSLWNALEYANITDLSNYYTKNEVDTLANDLVFNLKLEIGTAFSTELEKKVDKVSGKGLSTNDYTTAEKTKLSGIEEGANKTTIDTSLSTTSTNPVQNKVINTALGNKVDKVSGKGLSTNDFTNTYKTKLDGIQESATKVETSSTNGYIKINGAEAKVYTLPTDVVQDADYVHTDNNYTTTEKNKLAGIDNGANKTIVDSSLSTTSTNPVQNKVINTALGTKVDKVSGKGLSTNDYTDDDKEKLISVDENAQVNKIEKVQLGGTDLTISSKTVNIPLATSVGTSTNPITANAVNTAINNVNTNVSNNYINKNQKGVANGVATLGSDSKIVSTQLPDYLLGQVLYGGNVGSGQIASLTTKAKSRLGVASDDITLINESGNYASEGVYGWIINEGIYYIASDNFTFANMQFLVGDWLISNGTSWQKIDNTDAVTSVAGQTGAITLAIGDINGLPKEIETIYVQIDNKVEKEEGKRLSSNDYTSAEKSKLAGISAGAEVNVQSDWSATSGDAFIKNKPTKLSQFTNDLNLPNDNTTYTFEGGTNSFKVTPSGGTAQTVTVTPSIANATTSANGLMSSSDKTKLNGIETGANKTIVDSALSTTSTNPLQNKIITAELNDKVDKDDILILNCGNASGV